MASESRRGAVDNRDGAFDSIDSLFLVERLFAKLDPWLVGLGWSFGLLFLALGWGGDGGCHGRTKWDRARP